MEMQATVMVYLRVSRVPESLASIVQPDFVMKAQMEEWEERADFDVEDSRFRNIS